MTKLATALVWNIGEILCQSMETNLNKPVELDKNIVESLSVC